MLVKFDLIVTGMILIHNNNMLNITFFSLNIT